MPDRHAGELGRPLVAAHRVQPAAEGGAGDDEGHDGGEDDHEPHRRRQAQGTGDSEEGEAGVAEGLLTGQVGVGGALGDEQARAAGHVHGAEGGDEGGDAEPGDEQAVDRPHDRAEQQGHDDDHQDGGVGVDVEERQVHALEHHAGDDARQSHDRTDGQIDPPGEDDQQHAQRQQGVVGHVLGHGDQVGTGHEGVGQGREDDDKNEQGDEGALRHEELADAPVPDPQPGSGGTGGGHE